MTEQPELAEMSIWPYPYQADAVMAVFREFRTRKSTVVVMPTGSGKTETALFVARGIIEEGGRVLFLAHTDELCRQPREKAYPVGLVGELEKASDHACPHFTRDNRTKGFLGDADPKLVIGSVQTLQGKRLLAWPKGHFDLIVRDEAHRATSDSDRKIVQHFDPKWYLGLTATAVRGDGTPLVGRNQVFESLAFKYPLATAVEEGWLARPRFGCMDVDIDLGDLRVKGAADLPEKEVDKALLPHITKIANELREKLEGRRAVIFTPMCCSAERLADALTGFGVSTGFVSGETPDRATVVGEFKAGRYRHLVNAMVLTEGFDAAFVDTVVILRATKSWGLFVQMSGRCLRRFPGKEEGLILGVNWRNFQNLIHPVDIVKDSETTPEALEIAKGLIDSGEEPDLFSALKRGQATHAERERVRQFRVQEHAARARVEYADPLGFDPDFVAPSRGFSTPAWEQPATEKQAAILVNLGFKPDEVSQLSKAAASQRIGVCFERRDKGLATYKQLRQLKRFRVPDADAVTFAEAGKILDDCFAGVR